MRALLISDGSGQQWLDRASLRPATPGHDENWLQSLIFENAALIPSEALAPTTGEVIPICRELPIPKETGTVFLDILGITADGRLVLIECKLWRNPQARREVIGQILEYASLLRLWSYSDLTERLKAKLGWTGKNPLFEHVSRTVEGLDEARFHDQVTAALRLGDFALIVAGDGIRSDVQAITDHLNAGTGGLGRLALIEFQLWENEGNQTVVIPSVSLRTEVIRHRVLVSADGTPVNFVEEEVSDTDTDIDVDPEGTSYRRSMREFWQRFIDRAEFDHADQPPVRHGGHGWAKLPLPDPAGYAAAYRKKDGEAGIFVTFRGEYGREVFEALAAQGKDLAPGLKQAIDFEQRQDQPFEGIASVMFPQKSSDENELMSWFLETSNAFISALRPAIKAQVDRS